MKEKKKITYRELMVESLASMLKRGETLYCPLYGCYDDSSFLFAYGFLGYSFGFFGLTDDTLLIARLNSPFKEIKEYIRVPLPLQKLTVRKTLFLRQSVMIIKPQDGKKFKLHVADRVYQIGEQGRELSEFISRLRQSSSKNR